MNANLKVFPSKPELVKAVAERMVQSIAKAVRETGSCSIALAGGSTPRDVYARLAEPAYQNRISWKIVHLFWGDERTVPPDHPDSNYRMAQEALLNHIDIPPENVHRMSGETTPDSAAAKYAEILHNHFSSSQPQFDLVLLGMGDDGHTTSLFPETTALDEIDKTVAAVFVPKFDTWRITLTLPVLNAAKEVVFLVSGSSKARMIAHIAKLDQPVKSTPASLIHPANGTLTWMLDADAAALINES